MLRLCPILNLNLNGFAIIVRLITIRVSIRRNRGIINERARKFIGKMIKNKKWLGVILA